MTVQQNLETFNYNSLGLRFQDSQYNEETLCPATYKPLFSDDLSSYEMKTRTRFMLINSLCFTIPEGPWLLFKQTGTSSSTPTVEHMARF